MSLTLVKPDIKYKKSYIEALQEMFLETKFPEHLKLEKKDVENYIAHMESVAREKDLKNGEVARSEFWLIDGDRYIGKIQIRHKPSGRVPEAASHIYYEIRPGDRGKGYGNKLLKLGLMKAKEIGLSELIITSEKNNLPSIKIIEKNGGNFLEEIILPNTSVSLLKYKIPLQV